MQNVIEQHGGRVVFGGDIASLVIGEVDDIWDTCVLVEYPSAASFATIVTSPEVTEIGVHRAAGLEGQLLIRVTQFRSSPTRRELVDVPHTVVDDATGDLNPTLRAPGGFDHRSLALGDAQVAAEVVGDPHSGRSRRFIFCHTEIGGEKPRAQ